MKRSRHIPTPPVIGIICIVLAALLSPQKASGQSPKREFRGAWLATVVNLDWPTSRGGSPQTQRDQLITILDALSAAGFNAVIFQVRTECDALYQSPYEPWSYWLTGSQGTPPNPFYDPLEFAVQEAHKRGMELHAWFNPYRAYRSNNTYTTAATHVTKQNPAWVLTCPSGFKFLDPGLPDVRDHVSRVVSDVVRRYDIDGIHMDDYFYPYPGDGFTTEDSATFRLHDRGITSLDDWRRDNVNILIQQLYDSLQALKPWVKLGMSPFGIWRSGVPNGIVGMSAVDVIYCDALAWLRDGSIDYLTPQLYWEFGGGQDYGTLMGWWSDSTSHYGRHFYSGNATYRIITHNWPNQEIVNQLSANRANPNVQGSIQFRANFIRDNAGGITDRFRNEVFRYAAAPPVLSWKETSPPGTPTGLISSQDPGSGLYRLSWSPPPPATDGDTASRYLVYRFDHSNIVPSDLEISRNILALAGEPSIVPPVRVDSPGVSYTYGISALDRNNNESVLSGTVQLPISTSPPTLASPPPNYPTFSRTDALTWLRGPTDVGFRLQVASDSMFSGGNLLFDQDLTDTVRSIGGMNAQTDYYWRVLSGNQGGTSQYSAHRKFTTGWPLPPTIIAPHLVQNTPLMPTFTWSGPGGDSYRLRVTDNVTYQTVLDVTVQDTTYTATTPLTPTRIFTWTVRSVNPYGESDPSTEGRFRTTTGTVVEEGVSGPAEFVLRQNYPNPFNAQTVIRFSLRETHHTTLRVYNLLGQEIAVLTDQVLPPGSYTTSFDAGSLPSGMYVYVLMSGENRIAQRMVVLK